MRKQHEMNMAKQCCQIYLYCICTVAPQKGMVISISSTMDVQGAHHPSWKHHESPCINKHPSKSEGASSQLPNASKTYSQAPVLFVTRKCSMRSSPFFFASLFFARSVSGFCTSNGYVPSHIFATPLPLAENSHSVV